METKKCPRCGAEIPAEMSFCLHCMERTDGVLEIKRKSEPSRKMILSMTVLAVLMIIVIILLVMVLSDKGDSRNTESSAPYVMSENITENITTSTTFTETTKLSATSYNTVQTQSVTTVITTIMSYDVEKTSLSTQAIVETITSEIQSNNVNNITDENISPVNINDNNFNQSETDIPYTEQDNNYQEIISEDIIIPPSENENPVSEPPTVNNDIPETSFEDIFTERLNNWAGSRILTDTLSFNENDCTFNSSVGIDKVKCTVTANSEMTCFTLDIEPDSNYISYSTSIYIPAIINEITYFVLDYQISSSLQADIRKMFENFEADGDFSENNFSCDISTTEHNNGSYPINVSCSIS
ncbi:MAG: DUF2116 family Zn-ribbon domain-containing protein [Ruminococcus sp.]|nr:DUF2116 family Zn-ribbon domain-containing protein [Ruminococcus sp.]